MRKVTLTDIARECKVSKTLVSLVFNGYGDKYGISKDTQKRVFAVAEKLNYSTSRTGKPYTIGLIIPDIFDPLAVGIANGIEKLAEAEGLNLLICNSSSSKENELGKLKLLKEKLTDGFILYSSLLSSKEIQKFSNENCPLVIIGEIYPNININRVIVDNYSGAFEATEHLVRLGYKRVALFNSLPARQEMLKQFRRGYYDALKKYNLQTNKKLICNIHQYDIDRNITELLKDLIYSPNNLQAIFSTDTNLTFAILESVKELKINIPKDLAIVSYYDHELFKISHPYITAVSQPVEEISKNTVNILRDSLRLHGRKNENNVKIVLKPKLIIRESCIDHFKTI